MEIDLIKDYYGFNDDIKYVQNVTPKKPKMTQKRPQKTPK